MPELPVALSSVALRLAGETGQAALNLIAVRGAAAAAQLDQHIAAIRAELGACRAPMIASAQLAGLAAARKGRALRSGSEPSAEIDAAAHRSSDLACPDVPFTGTVLAPEAVPPLRLLLHYTCAFAEAAVSADWWPGESAASPLDWESVRLAALCELISRAEAVAELHPDLRAVGQA